MPPSLPQRLLLVCAALLALVAPLGATWSIVVVDRRTGEVCIASATCLPRLDLTALTPVILVGRGGGVTQSVLDDGSNKLRLFEGLLAGDAPDAILARIQAEDPGVRTRQFGIVDFVHPPLSYTGNLAGQARKSVAGAVDDLVYAIQGNVLASQAVIDVCEAALRTSSGDLGQRVMAAMVAARELGGDGRCSCGLGSLGDCGTPPPDFQKSAHIGFLLVARIGDSDGTCVLGGSCANGAYHLELNVKGADGLHADPDPVDQLVARHAAWRAARVGRPDGLRSRVRCVDSLPADGVTERTLTIELVDLEGLPLRQGGALVEVLRADGSPALTTLGPVLDRGDGTYTCSLRAGSVAGTERFVVRASDELVSATLYPFLELRSDPAVPLHAGRDALSAAAPESVPFVLSVPARPRAKYWLVARLGGGKLRGLGALPFRALVPAVAPYFPGPPGELDAAGRAEPVYAAPSAALLPLLGLRLEWFARVYGEGAPLDSNLVGFSIRP